MKYPEYRMSLAAALPSIDSIQSWLGHQLEVRGIDSIVYTRYIISLLQHECSDSCEIEELWEIRAKGVKKRNRKNERKKSPVSEEERRKMAVMDCLYSVAEQDCDIENLVEELWKRLNETKTSKDCCKALSINIDTTEEVKTDVTGSQDPAQRYYAAFPALPGEDSPSAISPCNCEVNAWKRNPLTGQLVGETLDKDITSSEDGKSMKGTQKLATKKHQEQSHQTKKRSKSLTETKENDSKTLKLDGRKRVYPKGRPKQQGKMKKVIDKHSNNIRYLSWPLTAQENIEKEGLKNEQNTDEGAKIADAEYCSKVEQIIKRLILSGINEQSKLSNTELRTRDSWMREESVSPELQENFEWYTQPLEEILLSPFSKSKRLYKRHSFPPAIYFDEDTDLESILGPLLSSVTSRYSFVHEVLSPEQVSEEVSSEDCPKIETEEIQSDLQKSPDVPALDEEQYLNAKRFTFDYSSPTNGQFSLFDYSEELKENMYLSFDSMNTSAHTEELSPNLEYNDDLTFREDEDQCNNEVSETWLQKQDLKGYYEDSSVTELCNISSCSSSFDSDSATDMSDFDGVFTFDLESEEESMSESLKVSSKIIVGEEYLEPDPECISPYSLDVPESTFFTQELLSSFNSVIESPKNPGVCSMLIDRNYLDEMIQMKIEDQLCSPYGSLSPTLCFNILSVDDSKTGNCWQSQVLLHEFLQTFDDECRITSVPWETVLGETGLRWSLTPKSDLEDLTSGRCSGSYSQLWDVNSHKKLPLSGLFWNVPCCFSVKCLEDKVPKGFDTDVSDDNEKDHWQIENGEIFLSQETIDEDAVIGVELLEELHKAETNKDDHRLKVNSWEKHERSVSDSDLHGLWSKYGHAKQEFHRSFELIPSETSAFSDVVPCKLHHVQSTPNIKFSSVLSLPAKKYGNQPFESSKNREPSEHLYFSNETHFRPIQTPVGTPHEEHVIHRDLFGVKASTSGTPYQKYRQPGTTAEQEEIPKFCPKFKVQKDLDKYIQTGRSLDDNYEGKTDLSVDKQPFVDASFTHCDAQTGDFLDVLVDADDPHGKESGFESNGEIEDSILLQKDYDDDDFDFDKCNWSDEADMTSKFRDMYLEDTENELPSTLTNVWAGQPQDFNQFSNYGHKWSAGFEEPGKHTNTTGDSINFLQYLPLVKHGELSFTSKNDAKSDTNERNKNRNAENPLEIDATCFSDNVSHLDMFKLDEFDTPKGDEGYTWPTENPEINVPGISHGFEPNPTEGESHIWTNHEPVSEYKLKTNFENDFTDRNYDVKTYDEQDFNIPNSVDELNRYYMGNITSLSDSVDHGTHEQLGTHGYNIEIIPPAPLPTKAIYSSELEDQPTGGQAPAVPPGVDEAPGLPPMAVYSSDLEKQWLDHDTEWVPYLSAPETVTVKQGKGKPKGSNRKPCSYFLEGACMRSDCKFSHDLSTITCRFWEDGMCFKGPLCPFLHGYYVTSDSDSNSTDDVDLKFEFKKDEFPSLKTKTHKIPVKEANDDKNKKGIMKERKKKIVSTKIHKMN